MSVLWEFHCILACATHGCFLVDLCSRCKVLLAWNRGDLHVCACGYEIGKLHAVPAPAPLVTLARLLSASIRASCHPGSLLVSTHPVSRSPSSPLNTVARIAAMMELQSRGFTRPRRKDGIRKSPPVLVEWMPGEDIDENDDESFQTDLARKVEALKRELEFSARMRFLTSNEVQPFTLDDRLSPFFGLDLKQLEFLMRFEHSQHGDSGDVVPSAIALWSGIRMTWEQTLRSREQMR